MAKARVQDTKTTTLATCGTGHVHEQWLRPGEALSDHKSLDLDADDDQDQDWGKPMHPACFSIFKRMSKERLGRIDINGLRLLWHKRGNYRNRFESFPGSPDIAMVNQQFYECVPGTEYLVAHPVRIPGLDSLIESCPLEDCSRSDTVFSTTNESSNAGNDPFTMLSPELKLVLVLHLARADVANLRLASESFQDLPQKYFHRLVLIGVHWVWDIEQLRRKQIDRYGLWMKLSAADGGRGTNEIERRWLKKHEYPSSSRGHLLLGLTYQEQEEYGIRDLPAGQRIHSDTQGRYCQALNC